MAQSLNIMTEKIRCGSTMVLVAATIDTELERLVDSAVRKLLKPNGHAVKRQDGSSSWIVDEVLAGPGGSMEWHQDGNRVRHERVQYWRSRTGEIRRQVLKKVWASF